jgi:tetratricopeptide (TPR) repeat protein
MGFLESSRLRLRLARLRKQVEAEPAPHGIAELARGYLAIGDRAAAGEVLDFGERLFKESDALARARAALRGFELEERLQRAKEQHRERASVATYLELADAYRSLGREDQYGATLREALERFQSDSTVLTQLGDLRHRRFHESFASPDALAAIELYERAIASERENLKAHIQLAELYWKIGAARHAKAALDGLLAICPDHERAKRLVRRVGRAADVATQEDLWSLLAEVEEHMTLRNGDETDGGAMDGLGQIDPIPEIERVHGRASARQAVYFDAKGAMHAKACDPEFADSVRRLRDVCLRATRGMAVGTPSSFAFEAEDGAILVEMKRGAAFGLLISGKSSREDAAVAARDALERLTRG